MTTMVIVAITFVCDGQTKSMQPVRYVHRTSHNREYQTQRFMWTGLTQCPLFELARFCNGGEGQGLNTQKNFVTVCSSHLTGTVTILWCLSPFDRRYVLCHFSCAHLDYIHLLGSKFPSHTLVCGHYWFNTLCQWDQQQGCVCGRVVMLSRCVPQLLVFTQGGSEE